MEMDVKFEPTFSFSVGTKPVNDRHRCQTVCTTPAGIVMVAFQNGFHVFRTASFEAACSAKAQELDSRSDSSFQASKSIDMPYDRTVVLPSGERQKVLFLVASCDNLTLAVVLQRSASAEPITLFYDIRVIFQESPVPYLHLVDNALAPGDIPLDACWNPESADKLLMCMSEGSVGIYTLVENGSKIAVQRLTKLKATAAAWSPRGKRVMVFGEGGHLEQYDAAKLTPVRRIEFKSYLASFDTIVTDILWHNNFSYLFAATTKNNDFTNPTLIFVHAPKEGPLVVKPFEDVCFPSDPASPTPRCQFFMRWCPAWLVAPVLSNRASEIAVVSSAGDFKDASMVVIDEEDGVIFPDATRFTGFAMDYTVQHGKGPLVYAVTSEGNVLCQFLYRPGPDVPSICAPPIGLRAGAPRVSRLAQGQAAPPQLQAQAPAAVVPPKSGLLVSAPAAQPSSKPALLGSTPASLPSSKPALLGTAPASQPITKPAFLGSTPSALPSSQPAILGNAPSSHAGFIPAPTNQATLPGAKPSGKNPQTPKTFTSLPGSPALTPRAGGVTGEGQAPGYCSAPPSPTTAQALSAMVSAVADRINKNLRANRDLFATIDDALHTAGGPGGEKATTLTALQSQGDRLERHLQALDRVAREAHSNALQLSSESAANLEYVERVSAALKHRQQAVEASTAPSGGETGISHFLKDMHRRVDNFEGLLGNANQQLDSLLAEHEMAERRRKGQQGAGMADPKMHQVYATLRTNAGAIHVQESRVNEVARLIEQLSLAAGESPSAVTNGVSNGSAGSGRPVRTAAGRAAVLRRQQSCDSPASSARLAHQRRSWSPEKDQALMSLLSTRKGVSRVLPSPASRSRAEEEKALADTQLFNKLEFNRLSETPSAHARSSSASPVTRRSGHLSALFGARPQAEPPARSTNLLPQQESRSFTLPASEKHVTFGPTPTGSSAPAPVQPQPSSILKPGPPSPKGPFAAAMAKTSGAPNIAVRSVSSAPVQGHVPSSTVAASAVAASVLGAVKAAAMNTGSPGAMQPRSGVLSGLLAKPQGPAGEGRPLGVARTSSTMYGTPTVTLSGGSVPGSTVASFGSPSHTLASGAMQGSTGIAYGSPSHTLTNTGVGFGSPKISQAGTSLSTTSGIGFSGSTVSVDGSSDIGSTCATLGSGSSVIMPTGTTAFGSPSLSHATSSIPGSIVTYGSPSVTLSGSSGIAISATSFGSPSVTLASSSGAAYSSPSVSHSAGPAFASPSMTLSSAAPPGSMGSIGGVFSSPSITQTSSSALGSSGTFGSPSVTAPRTSVPGISGTMLGTGSPTVITGLHGSSASVATPSSGYLGPAAASPASSAQFGSLSVSQFGTSMASSTGLLGSSVTATTSSAHFATSPTPTSGLFKSTATTPASSAPLGTSAMANPSLFRSAANSTTTIGVLSSSMVATTATTGSNVFGSGAKTSTTAGIFGSSTAGSSGLFGSSAVPSTSSGIFGSQAASTASSVSSGFFSSAAAAVATTTTSGYFSGATATANTSSSGLFGNLAAATTASSSGLFGSTTAPATGGAPVFGSSAATQANPSLFGNTAATTTSNSWKLGSSSAATSGSGLFGSSPAATASSGLFGTSAAAPAPSGLFGSSSTTTSSSSGLFGTSGAPTATSGLFGGASATTASSGLFGSAAANTTASTGLFGSSTSTAAGSSGLFGASSAVTTTSSGLFGSSTAATTASSGLFGTSTATTTASTGLFGQAAKSSAAPAGSGGLFGSPASGLFGQSSGGNSGGLFSSGGGLFGSTAAPPASVSSGGGLFSSSAAPPASVSSGGGLFGSSAAPASVSSGGGLFGSSAAPASVSSVGGLFGSSAAPPASVSSGGGLFGSSAAPPASVSSGGGLFGSSAQPSSGGLFSGLGGKGPSDPKNVFGTVPAPAGPSAGAGQSLFGGGHSSPFSSAVGNNSSAAPAPGGLFSSPVAASTASLNPAGSGFGAPPTFGSSPVFGASSGFGGGMTAGGFGDSRAATGGFGTMAQQGGSMSFGSLAQGGPSPGNAVFGSPQGAQAFGSPGGAAPASNANPSFTRRRA